MALPGQRGRAPALALAKDYRGLPAVGHWQLSANIGAFNAMSFEREAFGIKRTE
jgi:hypothetical protein